VPTTVLGQNDAGVGVKNGMNEHGMKNFVGTFAPPFAVLNDFSFLPTLADRDWIGGVAEAFKVAIIKDAAFFYFLCAKAAAIRGRDMAPMKKLVRRCARLHLDHIRTAGDPFELGSARPLDFGHWAGHKLESLSAYRLGHGQAAALGIALDSDYAARRELISPEERQQILDGMSACGLPVWDPLLEQRRADGTLEILDGLAQFREHLGGVLTVTLPQGIGAKIEVHTMDPDLLERGVRALKERHDAAGG
jgi:3-dehydroquinate synthase